MRQTVIWTAFGLMLSVVCGLAGLPHLSASLLTLTVFLSMPAMCAIGLGALSRRRVAR
jgi:hypothetical protein